MDLDGTDDSGKDEKSSDSDCGKRRGVRGDFRDWGLSHWKNRLAFHRDGKLEGGSVSENFPHLYSACFPPTLVYVFPGLCRTQ